MTTLRQRINQLRFALRYMYGVPESILDKIDVEAYADNKLEFKENLKVLEEAYPELREYIERNKDLETVAETTYEDFIEELKYLLTELAEGDEEAKRQMEMLGMTPSEAVDAILFYLEEQTKPVTVKKVVEKKVIKKESNLEKLKNFYRAYLRGLGIKNVEEEMRNAEGDIKALAEAVDKGRMSLKEAEERIMTLAPPTPVEIPVVKIEEKKIVQAPEIFEAPPPTEEEEEELWPAEIRVMLDEIKENPRPVIYLISKGWQEIKEKGAYSYFEGLGVDLTKKDIKNIAKLIYSKWRAKEPRSFLEWLITLSPYAKDIISLMLIGGIFTEPFREYMRETYEELKPQIKDKVKFRLPSTEEFISKFEKFLLSYPL